MTSTLRHVSFSHSSVLLTYPVGADFALLSLTTVALPSVRLHTVGNRAFPVAASKVWNSLPDDIVSSASLYTFCRLLKTFLFSVSFFDLILQLFFLVVTCDTLVVLEAATVI